MAEAFEADQDPAPAPQAGSDKPFKHSKAAKFLIDDDNDDDGALEAAGAPPMSECSFWTVVGDGSSQKPPEEFRDRPEWVQLESEGLTAIPDLKGVGMSLHKFSKQWHSRYGLCSELNTAPTYGHLRSPRKALLIAMRGMWKWYASKFPSAESTNYLNQIEKALEETSF